MQINFENLSHSVWIAIAIVWLVSGIFTKANARSQSIASRYVHILLMVIAFGLLVKSGFRIGFLGWRMLPENPVLPFLGLACMLAGAIFAIWARLMLGRNWSSNVTIKDQHELICRGPYRLVRHPIYSGFLFTMFGNALIVGETGGFVGVLLGAIAFWSKSRIEEAFLEFQFGPQYADYRRRVKALIPAIL